MDRLKLRENLGKRFEPFGWHVLSWNVGIVLVKVLQINAKDKVCVYLCENGYCGLIINFENNSTDLSIEFLKEYRELYDKYDCNPDLYFRLLKWNDELSDSTVVCNSFLEEEFDSKTRKYLLGEFKDFMICVLYGVVFPIDTIE